MDATFRTDCIAVLENLKDHLSNSPAAMSQLDGLLRRLAVVTDEKVVVAVDVPVVVVAAADRRLDVRDAG